VLEADLTKPGVENRIHRTTEEAGIKVDFLVNNAGLAYCGELVETESSVLENVMRLNAHVVTSLTRLYGKGMKERRRGRILFVSSVTGAFPGVPGSAVYAASKSYQRSLATSLAKELEPYGVGVTHILPGAVRGTEFGQESNIQNALCWKYPFYSRSSQEVASRGIRALLCGDTEVIPGFLNRLWLKVLQPMLPQRISIMVAEVSWSPFHFNFSPLFCNPFGGEKTNNQISSQSTGQKWNNQFSIASNNDPIILSLDIEKHLSEKKSNVSSEFAQNIDSQFELNSSKEEHESEIHYHQVDKSKSNDD
jgi:short-subunit dehydrogenase